jgi:hypothetical protein
VIKERYSIGADPTLVLEIPCRVTGAVLTNTGAANVVVDTDPAVKDGFTLPPGATITVPSSASQHYATRLYAVADGEGGEITTRLPEW